MFHIVYKKSKTKIVDSRIKAVRNSVEKYKI